MGGAVKKKHSIGVGNQ